MAESAVSRITWEELEQELFTPEEIAESNERVVEMSAEIRSKMETETQER